MGIRSKLILSTCIPLLAIYLGVLTWDYAVSSSQALRYIKQLVTQRAKADAGLVNARFVAVQGTVDRVAYGLAMRNGGAVGNLNGQMSAALRLPWIDAVWVRFINDTQPGRGPTDAGFRKGDRRQGEEFKPNAAALDRVVELATREGKTMWLDPADAGDLGTGPGCAFVAPFYSAEGGRLLGVVGASVPVESLRHMRDEPNAGPGGRVGGGRIIGGGPPTTQPEPQTLAEGGYLLVDGKGNILSRPDGRMLGAPLAVGPDDDELRGGIEQALKGSNEVVVAGGLNQTLGADAPRARYVLAMQRLPSTGWLYVTAAPESELLGPVQDRLINRAIFLFASLVVVVAALMFVLTRFCRPIEQMADTVRQIAAGDLNTAPVPVVAKDELGQLAKGFNDMTGRLRHHVQELTDQSAEREKVESELRIARQIQADLLPRTFPPFPDRPEFLLHAVNIPARHIAGDFFDFFFVGDDKLMVVIADVSGKGVPAALMMAVTRTMVRNLAETGLSPQQIIDRVNRMLVDDTTPGLFVTMILGQYEPATGDFTYVNAGHPSIVCVCDGRATTCCEATSPLVGVVSGGELGPYGQQTFNLAPGATLLFYTDGVTEAHDETNVLFGEQRLLDCVEKAHGKQPPDLCEAVVSTVMAYQHQSVTDDLTLVCLHREANTPSV